jgi:hypothetical protein
MANEEYMTDQIITERIQRIDVINEKLGLKMRGTLLTGTAIPPALYEQLKRACNEYLLACVATHTGKYLKYEDDCLLSYEEKIKQLPNITPNGIIMPKRETNLQFNRIHQALVAIIKNLNIDDLLEKIHLPLALRLSDGESKSEITNRPLAVTKWHIETWAGQCNDAVIGIPIMGDLENTTVEFSEPIGPIPDNFLDAVYDFNEGPKRIEGTKLYDAKPAFGNVYMWDEYCIHRTVKHGGRSRLSIDICISYKNHLDSDAQNHGHERSINMIPLEEWYDVGNSTMLVENQTFAECIAQFSENKVKNKRPSCTYTPGGLQRVPIIG